MAFRDPFKLVSINNIAEIADKFTRNEILTSNEIRQIIGFKPSDDPKADQLVNGNISQPTEQTKTAQEDCSDETLQKHSESEPISSLMRLLFKKGGILSWLITIF